ncbi:MAG: glycosyltransferase [Alistipes sp.]
MEKPKVSVIVPVYNTAPYVEEAVRSVMKQTLRDIEIWIIDDGSTDESPSIVSRLACEEARIHIFTQPNKGLSEARNAGIERAAGRYLYFMDSDDLLESDALELCYDKCEQQQLEVVFFDADTFGADVSACPWFDYHRSAAFEDCVYAGAELLERMFKYKKYIASACLYLVRRDLLTTRALRFYPGILHEDELFTTSLFLDAQRVGRINRAFFKRRLRPDSIMGQRFAERNLVGYLTVFAQLRLLVASRSAASRQLIDCYIRYTLNPVLRNAWALPWRVRWHTARVVVGHYMGCVGVSSLAILLVKAPFKKYFGR